MTTPNQPNYAATFIDAGRLRDALANEKAAGFANKSIPDGMDPFIKEWGLAAHAAVHHPMFRSLLRRFELLAPAYAAKSTEQRQAWVEKVLRWCEGIISGSTPVPIDESTQ